MASTLPPIHINQVNHFVIVPKSVCIAIACCVLGDQLMRVSIFIFFLLMLFVESCEEQSLLKA